ncbi:MAG: 2-hydroxyglutaryl-CoA dehydratase [Deltaproteobacteria bacterium]|nr:2-hydroxyglutaryl-CoA dehydratase [Deltaproteobacteria bacterium]
MTSLAAGLDMGALWTKAVAVRDGAPCGSAVVPTGDDSGAAAERALREALAPSGATLGDLAALTVTGAGRKALRLPHETATDVLCAARGAAFAHPGARVVLDLGAESTRAVKLDQRGEILEYALNDKCAAGTGVFLDAIAAVLKVPIEEIGPLSLRSSADVAITSMCVAFAESEVVSLVHRRTPREDILRGLHRAIAARIFSLAGRVGLEQPLLAVGGMALNVGITTQLEELAKLPVVVPAEPRTVNALGAALLAAARGGAS